MKMKMNGEWWNCAPFLSANVTTSRLGRCLVIYYVRFISKMKCVFCIVIFGFCCFFSKKLPHVTFIHISMLRSFSFLRFHSSVLFLNVTFLTSSSRQTKEGAKQCCNRLCFGVSLPLDYDEYESWTRDHRDTLRIVHSKMKTKTKYSQPFRYHAFFLLRVECFLFISAHIHDDCMRACDSFFYFVGVNE